MSRFCRAQVPLAATMIVAICLFGCPVPKAEDNALIDKSLRIDVEVDGKDQPPINAAWLTAQEPDFTSDDGHRAWRFSTLLGERYSRPRSVLEIETASGLRTRLHPGEDILEGKEPVLIVNRKGEPVLAILDPADPFPGFHGRGTHRGREGAAAERIRDPKKIRLYVAGFRHKKEPANNNEKGSLNQRL